MLSEEQIKQLVREYMDNGLRWMDEVKKRRRNLTPEIIEAEKSHIITNIDAFKQALALSNTEFAEPLVDKLLKQNDITLNRRSAQYKQLALDLMKGQIAIYNTELQRLGGNYDNDYDKFLASALQKKLSGRLLSSVIDEYTSTIIGKGTWTGKNKAEMLGFYTQFVKIMGDRDISTYDAPDSTRYISILRKFPWNISKMKEVRNKPLQEIIELIMNDKVTWKTLSDTTVRKNIVRINSLFNYAQRKGYVTINHFVEFKQKRKAKREKKRLPYNTDELKRWFNSPVYTEYSADKIRKKPERFWVPLIMLFSGCRTGEVCQLHKQDIYAEEGILCFHINDENDKRIKTEESARKVPVHPFLKELGLLKYVKNLKGDRLFSGLKKGRDGYASLFNKWADRYNRKFITSDTKKVPYSFRHSFTNCLKQKGVSRDLIEEMTGHVIEGVTFPDYTEAYNVKMRFNAIKKAEFKVDFSHIKYPFQANER